MSIKVMNHVWEYSDAKGGELLLLLALADHAADDGYCWPTIETLAHKIRMSPRSVIRQIKVLEERGELVPIRAHRNNRYIVTMGRLQADIDVVLRTRTELIGDKMSPMTRDKMSPIEVTSDKGVTSIGDTCVTSEVTQLCHPNHQEPSWNHQEKHQEREREAHTPDFSLFSDTWITRFTDKRWPTGREDIGILKNRWRAMVADPEFVAHWEEALKRVALPTSWIKDKPCWRPGWFLDPTNTDGAGPHWRKCYEGDYNDTLTDDTTPAQMRERIRPPALGEAEVSRDENAWAYVEQVLAAQEVGEL